MYVLVFWLASKTTSIISLEDLCPDKEEGEETFANYGEKKRLYKAKIMRKSDDRDYLSYLKVTTDGEILIKGKNSSKKIAVSQKNVIKQNERIASKRRKINKDATDFQLLNEEAVFEEPECNEWISNDEAGPSSCLQNSNHSNSCNAKDSGSSEVPEIGNGDDDDDDDDDENDEAEIANLEKLLEEKKKKRALLKRKADENRAKYKSCQKNDEITISEENPEEEDPLVLCGKAGHGRVQLCDAYNVWIDKGDLIFAQRWLDNPREMVRCLLKMIVGVDNLKRMCARGNSKNRLAVPKDIVTCVEYYVNKKCSRRLSPSEFTDVINYLCGTLRAEEAKRVQKN